MAHNNPKAKNMLNADQGCQDQDPGLCRKYFHRITPQDQIVECEILPNSPEDAYSKTYHVFQHKCHFNSTLKVIIFKKIVHMNYLLLSIQIMLDINAQIQERNSG